MCYNNKLTKNIFFSDSEEKPASLPTKPTEIVVDDDVCVGNPLSHVKLARNDMENYAVGGIF